MSSPVWVLVVRFKDFDEVQVYGPFSEPDYAWMYSTYGGFDVADVESFSVTTITQPGEALYGSE